MSGKMKTDFMTKVCYELAEAFVEAVKQRMGDIVKEVDWGDVLSIRVHEEETELYIAVWLLKNSRKELRFACGEAVSY